MRVLVAAATPLQEFLLKGRVELGRTEHRLLVVRAGYVRVKHFVMGRRAHAFGADAIANPAKIAATACERIEIFRRIMAPPIEFRICQPI
ncbi:MAG: hypothetical protein WB774_08895 [Xanthobacteraceae bacterium]